MIQHGYEGAFALVMVLSILGSLIIGGCIGVCVMNGYTSGKISPDGKSGGNLLQSLSVMSNKGNRLIIQGGESRRNSIEMIEQMHETGQQALKESAEKKRAQMNKRVAERLNSRKNRMAMKLSKSKALQNVDCFKYLGAKHMSMVIGKMRLISYEKGKELCKQGDPANEFFVCMEGSLEVYVHDRLVRSMGELEWLGERALVSKDATRGATIKAATASEVFVLSRMGWNDLEKEGVPVGDVRDELQEKMSHYEEEDKRLYDMKMNGLRAEQLTKKASKVGISRQSSSQAFVDEIKEGKGEELEDFDENEVVEF